MNIQVAEIIKEDLWPNPLKYFNNVIFRIFPFQLSLDADKELSASVLVIQRCL